MHYSSPPFSSLQRVDIPRELPRTYGEDTLVPMVKDPGWIFAYWEVSDQTRQRIQDKFGAELHGSEIVLRVFERPRDFVPDDEAVSYFDITVGTLIGSWYLQLRSPGLRIRLELGYRTTQKSFILLLRSDSIGVPHEKMSEWLDSEWMEWRLHEELASESFLRVSG